MRILLAADIFGVTGHLLEIAAVWEGAGSHCRIAGPYPPSLSFDEESLAYAAFIQHGGVDSYAAEILGILAESGSEPTVCIGFSAGAAALWQVLADPVSESVCLAVCLYGSQIRNAVEVNPRCPCLLVFPESEPHFSVAEVLGRLEGRENVCCTTVPWRHGYMNRLSKNFDQEGYGRTLDWLGRLLSQQDLAGDCRGIFNHLAGAAPDSAAACNRERGTS